METNLPGTGTCPGPSMNALSMAVGDGYTVLDEITKENKGSQTRLQSHARGGYGEHSVKVFKNGTRESLPVL